MIRRVSLSRILTGCWVTSILLSTYPTPSAAAPAAWVSVETSDVTIISNGPVSQARDIAKQLAQYRMVVSDYFPEWRFETTRRPTLYVVDHKTWVSALQPFAGVSGFEVANRRGHAMVVNGDDWRGGRSVFLHEMTHHFFNLNRHGHRFPLWYQEGLADFLSTARVWWSVSSQAIELGLLPPGRGETLWSDSWVPLRDVFTATEASELYKDPKLREHLYAESWLLVDYAFLGSPKWTEGMKRFLEAYASGRSGEEALDAALPGDHGQFETEVLSYVRAGRYPLVRRSLPKPATFSVTEHALSETEGRFILSQFLIEQYPDRPSTLDFVRVNALRETRTSPSALLMGTLYERLGRHEDAYPWVHPACDDVQLITAGLKLCGDAELSRAMQLAGIAGGNGDMSQATDAALAARAFYDRARAAGDDYATLLISYGDTQLLAPGGDPSVRGRLEALLKSSPGDSYLADVVAGLWLEENAGHSLEILKQAILDAESVDAMNRLEVKRKLLEQGRAAPASGTGAAIHRGTL